MGGAVSSGRTNNELVDNLMEYGYIRTKRVEAVFRAVDRADYILPCHKESAYKDLAWKHGHIHLSAPCVYSEVMEGLSLEPGSSFLNLGSGTGYLSTMAGLILGQNGTNHGIELHESCVKYAYERLEDFKYRSAAMDAFDFCEPLFVQGNCLNIIPGRQYDRVYCGAACPESHETFIKQFVRIGGILVIPFEDHLLRMQRIGENVWSHFVMLPVSFATLVIPSSTEQNLFHLPECNPLSLQELCRGKIRNRIRKNITHEYAALETKKTITVGGSHKPSPPQRGLRNLVIPIFEESDESLSDDEDAYIGRARFLFNVGGHPDEAISTTLQLVRAVVQQQQRQSNDPVAGESTTDENTIEENDGASSDLNSETTEVVQVTPDGETSKAEIEPTAHSSADQNNESSSDSACDKSERDNWNKSDKNVHRITKDSLYYESDSESDGEHENVLHRKKVPKREKTDSGIVDDLYVTTDDSSSSSNPNLYDPEIADVIESIDSMDVDLYDIMTDRFGTMSNSHLASRNKPTGGVVTAHYLDQKTFAGHMMQKVNRLPLPSSLRHYLNYNRAL